MDTKNCFLSLFAFVLGIVLWLNWNNITSSTNSFSGFNTAELAVFEFLIILLVFGGGVFMIRSFEIEKVSPIIWIAIVIVLILLLILISSIGFY